MSEQRVSSSTSRQMRSYTMKGGPQSGTTYELVSLQVMDWDACQDECVQRYRRAYIETYKRNVDLLPADQQATVLQDAFERATQMDYGNLPKKKDDDGNDVEYFLWWLGENMSGGLFCLWLSMRRAESQRAMTLDQVDGIFAKSPADLAEAIGIVTEISMPRLAGNSQEPLDNGSPAAAKEKRRRRRRQRK